MSKVLSLLVFCFLLTASLFADETFVVLEGHLNEEAIKGAKEKLESLDDKQIVILINSSTGDLDQVFSFARELYQLKTQKGLNVIVYIDDNAVGPAAIIPFLADKLYTSVFVTWGDIPLGTSKTVPTNLLRNRVTSLIPEESSKVTLLTLMAEAMVDQDLLVVNDNGWKRHFTEASPTKPVVSPKGERLIVSHRQLRQLDLITDEMSLTEFKNLFDLPESVEITPTESAAIKPKKANLLERLKEHITVNSDGPNIIGRIAIDDRSAAINQGTWLKVKTALDHYKKIKPIFIILDLNTPGGEVFASQKISDALQEMDTQYNIPVVCAIDNWAISAGAMLAYSCRFIAVSKDAAMGAAEVVKSGSEGQIQTASEKINSAIRTDFANRASFFGRNPLIAEAMVDKDMILVLRFGKFVKLNSEDDIRKEGPSPDIVVSAKGKLLTLNAEQMIEYGVADLMMQPEKLPLVTASERSAGKWPADKELLFHQQFFDNIPEATIETHIPDWKTKFLAFLANPVVAAALFAGMMIGFYVELNTPGFGFPGAIGVTCLFFMMLSSFAFEAVNWLEVIIIVAGLTLLAIDLFLIPSFGIIGGLGILLFIGGLMALMIPGIENIDYDYDTSSFNAAGEFVMERMAWLVGGLIVSLVAIILLARYVFPALAPFSRFVLYGGEQEGYVSGADPSKLPQPGEMGEVTSTLRPSGKIIVGGKYFEAVSDGEFIEKGTKVSVLRLDGSVIIVGVNK